MPPTLDRLIYIDDSGHPQSGTAVYGWIEVSPDRWASTLRTWLDTRTMLWREFGIPAQKELHSAEYINGRGRISKKVPDRHIHQGHEYWKDFGREVAEHCLDTLRCTEGLKVGAVTRSDSPALLHRTRRETYAALISRFEAELLHQDALAIVFMDGDGSDASYRSTHRNLQLSQRRVIEDAIHLDSTSSQLVQMADLVAWCANAHLARHPRSEFAWDWYSTYLTQRDPHRLPRAI